MSSTQAVITGLLQGFLHLLLKVLLLVLWTAVKALMLVLGKVQAGLERYLQNGSK